MKKFGSKAFKRQLKTGNPVTLQGLFEVTITTGFKTKNIFITNPTFTMCSRKEINVESTITNANGLTQHFTLTVAKSSKN